MSKGNFFVGGGILTGVGIGVKGAIGEGGTSPSSNSQPMMTPGQGGGKVRELPVLKREKIFWGGAANSKQVALGGEKHVGTKKSITRREEGKNPSIRPGGILAAKRASI